MQKFISKKLSPNEARIIQGTGSKLCGSSDDVSKHHVTLWGAFGNCDVGNNLCVGAAWFAGEHYTGTCKLHGWQHSAIDCYYTVDHTLCDDPWVATNHPLCTG